MAAVDVQYERDLRSAAQDTKRSKDHRSKWAFGMRPHPGCQVSLSLNPDGAWQKTCTANEVHAAKIRPVGRKHPKPRAEKELLNQNHNREQRGHSYQSRTRIEGNFGARDEIRNTAESRSIINLLPTSPNVGARDNFLYSFDNTDSPAPTMPLDAFIKPDVRETEKFVEKEYEILDANGEAVRGKKARRTLRQASSASPETHPHPAVLEDDDFELV